LKNEDARLEGIQQAWRVEEMTKGEHYEISLLLESKGPPQASLTLLLMPIISSSNRHLFR